MNRAASLSFASTLKEIHARRNEVRLDKMTDAQLDEYGRRYAEEVAGTDFLVKNGWKIGFEYWLSLHLAAEKCDVITGLWKMRSYPPGLRTETVDEEGDILFPPMVEHLPV